MHTNKQFPLLLVFFFKKMTVLLVFKAEINVLKNAAVKYLPYLQNACVTAALAFSFEQFDNAIFVYCSSYYFYVCMIGLLIVNNGLC